MFLFLWVFISLKRTYSRSDPRWANHNRGTPLGHFRKQARWRPRIWYGPLKDLLKTNKQLQAFVDTKDVFMELPTRFGKVDQRLAF